MYNTGIGYKGEINLTIKLGDSTISRKVYNKGWSQLFRLIALVLTGNMSSEEFNSLKPTYIDIMYKNSDNVWETCLFSVTPVVSSYSYEEDNKMNGYGGINYISSFAVTISYSNLDISKIDDFDAENTDCRIFLLSGELSKLASLKVDPQALKDLQAGSQIIVDWTMKFFNVGDNE